MKLHANAALSLNNRRLLVARVIEEGWSLTKAAEAAEVSEPTARTTLDGWAYGAIYRSSAERTAALEGLPAQARRPRPKATGSSARRAEQRARVLQIASLLGTFPAQGPAALEAAGLWA
jgi:hypothetical protein